MEQPERANEPPRKKLAEMTPEERREYNLQAKSKSRAKAKEKLGSNIPVASDYEVPKAQRDQLAESCQEWTTTIAGELADKLSSEDEHMIQLMSDVLVAHERKWTKQVRSPDGYLYGHVFPDAAASDVIAHVHRFPKFLESQTFTNLYQQFLKTVLELSRNVWFEPEFAKDIESEVNGTYTLPPEPESPKAPLPPAPEPRFRSDAEVLAEGGAQLLENLRGQLPPDAFRYLSGGSI